MPLLHTPEDSRGEDEKGERAWEDIDCGEVLPDMTGPSVACTEHGQHQAFTNSQIDNR